MTGMAPWVYREHDIQGGLCPYCQRHYKNAHNWASHISRNHQGVWASLRARHEAPPARQPNGAGHA